MEAIDRKSIPIAVVCLVRELDLVVERNIVPHITLDVIAMRESVSFHDLSWEDPKVFETALSSVLARSIAVNVLFPVPLGNRSWICVPGVGSRLAPHSKLVAT